MQRKIVLIPLVVILIAIPAVISVSSPSNEFTVSPDVVYINWTDASGLGSYSANISIVWNASYSGKVVIENSTNTSWLVPSFIPGASIDNCGFPGNILADSSFLCTKIYVLPDNTTELLNQSNITELVLRVNTTSLISGRYFVYQNLTIRNETNSSESVKIPVYLDIPIKIEGRKGIFGKYKNVENITQIEYKIKANNTGSKDAHFFYFNTSAVENVTAVLINLSSSADLDMFLLDGAGNLKASAVSKGSLNEEIIYSRPSSGYWKILIYGNSSQDITYEGNVVYYTLNVFDSSGSEINKIDLGNINTTNSSDTIKTKIYLVSNQGNFTYSNVKENILLYRRLLFSGSGNKTFSFLVPSTQTVKAVLRWNGTTNYKIYLYNSSDVLLASSENMHNCSRILKLENKQIVQAQSNPGLWKVKVEGDSTDPFILEIMEIESSSNWFTSNYSSYSGFFNYSDSPNSSVFVNLTLSLPENAIDGDYEGYIEYREDNGKGAAIRVPLNLSVLSAVLTGDNKFYSVTKSSVQNIYRPNTFNFTVYLNNTGRFNATDIVPEISNLTYGSSHAWVKAIYFNSSLVTDNFTLPAGTWGVLEIEVDTSTVNETGVHTGNIILNASQSKNAVRPSSIFTITLKLNMTDIINGVISGLSEEQVNVSQTDVNITVELNLTYANGTAFDETLSLENIKCVKLSHKNTTYSTSCLKKSYYSTAQSIVEGKGKYIFNFTVPRNTFGGYYDLIVNFTSSDGKLKGEARRTFLVEGDALAIDILYHPSSMQNGTEAWLNISITNYGLNKSSNAELTIESNLISGITQIHEKGCTITPSGKTITFTLDAQKSCRMAMKIKASSSGGEGTVYLKGTRGLWIKNASFYLTVTAPSPSDENTTQEIQSQQKQQPSATQENVTTWVKDILFMQYPSLIQIKQGESEVILIVVKNTGNITLFNLTLNVEGIDSSWVSISPMTDLNPDKTHTFTVNITVPENAKIEKKTIKFVASSNNFSKSIEASLEILPSEKYKQEVEQNLISLKEIYKNVSSLYNSYKEKGMENEEIANKLSTIETLLSQAEDLIKANDYTSAANILSTVNTLLNETKTMINELEKELGEKSKQKLIMIIALISIALGGGFLIYLLLPPPHGYEPEKGFRYVPPHYRGKPRLKKLIHELKEIKNKILNKLRCRRVIFE